MDKGLDRKINMIVDELIRRGYEAIRREIDKNGFKKQAIEVKTEFNVRPLIYIEEIIEEEGKKNTLFSEVVDIIEELIKSRMVEGDFDIENIMTKKYVMENVTIVMQRESDMNVIKRPGEFEGTECIVSLNTDFNGLRASIKVTEEMLLMIKATEEELWQQALENTINDTMLISMAEELPILKELPEDQQIYILTNTIKYKGAAAVLNKKAIKELSDRICVKSFAIIPSSIHECLILPNPTPEMEIEKRVMKTNRDENALDPEEILSDKPIFINFTEV